MRHVSPAALSLVACVTFASQATGQQTTIHATTPELVVAHLKAILASQRFVLESANKKHALFTRDEGLVTQQGNSTMPVVHIVIELQLRFKQKGDSLVVTASEEAVGERGRPMELRKPVYSDRDNLQKMLDSVRAELEATGPALDSTVKRDSTVHSRR